MHAVLITAYKDYPALERLVRRLDYNFFKVYIHVDRRSAIGRSQIAELERLGAFVTKRYRVRWGSISHLDAMIDLLRRSLAEGGMDYVHLISGQDYPLGDVGRFETQCDGRIFMEFAPIGDESDYIKDRYRTRNVFYFLQIGSRASNRVYRYLDHLSRWVQKRARLDRQKFGPFRALYKGTMWMSFPAAAAAELISDPLAAEFLRAIRTTYLPEEIFFQTYFLNSHLSQSVTNDNARYVDWRERHRSIPAFLDASDTEPVLRSNALFARKLSSEVSAELLDQIDAACFDDRKAGEAAE